MPTSLRSSRENGKRRVEAHGRDKEATARALGIDLATLYRKMKKFEIEG